MLEDLDRIDWKQLDFPQLPNLIRELASGDPAIRESAYGELYDKGLPELPKASPFIVPFLIELLKHNNVEQKETLLLLLMQMAGEATAYLNYPPSAVFCKTVLEEIAKGLDVYQQFLGNVRVTEITRQLLDYLQ